MVVRVDGVDAVADEVAQLPAVDGDRMAAEGAELRAVRRELVVVVEVLDEVAAVRRR